MSADPSVICAFCDQPATDTCPRCERPRCEKHGPDAASWPARAYPVAELCPSCARAIESRSRKAVRVAVAGTAAIAGMATGAFAAVVLAAVFGLSADATVLSMLVAEMLGGGMSAYGVDRRVRRWYLARDQRVLGTLPEARLLRRGHSADRER